MPMADVHNELNLFIFFRNRVTETRLKVSIASDETRLQVSIALYEMDREPIHEPVHYFITRKKKHIVHVGRW